MSQGGRPSRDQVSQGVQHDADSAADQRAVDANELEILSDLDLHFFGNFLGVPTFDDIRNQT